MRTTFKPGDLVKPIAWDNDSVGVVLEVGKKQVAKPGRKRQFCRIMWSNGDLGSEWNFHLELVESCHEKSR